jgi:hypothetical protein
MIVFAIVGILICTVIACVGLVCAHYDSDDLRKMGIRL